MRTPNAAAQALLARIAAGELIPPVQLVRLDLTAVTLRYTTAGTSLQWGGYTWAAVGGNLEALEFGEGGEIPTLVLTLPGVTTDDLALALTEQVEGRPCMVYDALVDPATGVVADALLAWSGTLNVPAVSDGPRATVTVTAEHAAIGARRTKPSRYTNADQQALYPGDTALDFDPATDSGPVPWPAAEYFRQ